MKKIRPLLFACMLVFLSLSLTACAGRKSGNMNETSNNRATSSAAAETGTGENGMTGDTASGWRVLTLGRVTFGLPLAGMRRIYPQISKQHRRI